MCVPGVSSDWFAPVRRVEVREDAVPLFRFAQHALRLRVDGVIRQVGLPDVLDLAEARGMFLESTFPVITCRARRDQRGPVTRFHEQ